MIQTAYVSSAVPLLSGADLEDILEKSREKNRRLGVTGMLLYKDGNILQVLEGEPESVLPLYDTIARDPRHRGVIKLYSRTIERRDFEQWSMAYGDLRDVSVNLASLSPSQASKLIEDFRQRLR